ncbi:hypothetical protein PINS_up022051 [Pythium insidiosum]|nr:hypothetical protein PINS_up022051 [Pythium insidiosum]
MQATAMVDPLDALLQRSGQELPLDADDPASEVDLSRLSAKDRDAILARVTPDDSLPPDAFALSQNEIRREMIDRGIQPKGFYNDDAARLQDEFNREHAAEKESRMHQKMQLAAKAYLRETVHRRKMERDRELREEVAEIARDAHLEVWLELLRQQPQPPTSHATESSSASAVALTTTVPPLPLPTHAALRVSSVGARALCKALVFNHSLTSLTLSRNALDDGAAKHIAALLRRPTSALRRLDLEGNALGPLAARELAEALGGNETLESLSLESNPLTDQEKDWSGVAALSAMLARNRGLRSLSLWRTRLGSEGGKLVAQGVAGDRNTTLLCLDVGNNRVAPQDAVRLDAQLARNRRAHDVVLAKQHAVRDAQRVAAQQEAERQDARRREQEHAAWIEARKEERARERAEEDARRQRERQEEEDRQRQRAARRAAEFAARLELEKKKKKKGKGGGKKKKK